VERVINDQTVTDLRERRDGVFESEMDSLGDGEFVNDPLDTFDSRAVVKGPRLQELMKHVCEHGFEHHAAMNASHKAGPGSGKASA
jgi:L-fucose isomerase-like protein